MNISLRFKWLGLGLLLLVLSTLHVAAQSDERGWDIPVNLSQSGAAAAPSMVVDDSGVLHLFWQDDVSGYFYTNGDGESWQPAQRVAVPFADPPFTQPGNDTFSDFSTPLLIADEEALLHASWVTDDEFELQYSRSLVADAAAGSAGWTAVVTLAEPVAAHHMAADRNGRLHLTYVRTADTEEFPAGLYHRRSADGGATWSAPVLLYASFYFRTLESTDAFTQVFGDGGDSIFVTWDNPALDTVFLIRSPDGGESWGEPQVIDQREPTDPAGAASPAHVTVFSLGDDVHLSWWSGDNEDELKCLVYHQWSSDGGDSWQEAQVVYENPRNCPQDLKFFQGKNDLLYLMTISEEVATLQAWNGQQWTAPDPQQQLVKFNDPVTFRDVTFGCQQTAVTANNRLYAAGCGSGNARDVWLLNRPLGEQADWFDLFEATPVWQAPSPITSNTVHLLPAEVVAGSDGRLHAFWSQSNDGVGFSRLEQASTEVGSDLYYARLNAGAWSAPRPVLRSPEGKTDQISVAAGSRDSLFVVWSSGKDGGIYFSRALADRASSATEWIDPVSLPAPQTTGSWPDMLVDEAGDIYVAYTIPLNEDRGIYMVHSTTNGDSWSDPVQVFDGLGQGWQVVGRPKMARTIDGTLHLIWTRDVPTSNETLSLVYAQSSDNGESWSEPQVIAEETIVWSDLVGIGDRTVHLAWLGLGDGRALLWHQVSYDNGLAWQQRQRVSDPSMISGPSALVLDERSNPHLVQLAQTTSAALILQEWIWDGENWQAGEPLDLGETAVGADALAAALAPDGRLGVVYGTLITDPETLSLEDFLFYTSRVMESANIEATPLPTLTPTPLPTLTPTPESIPPATPTVSLPQVDNQPGGFSLGPINAGTSAGGILVGVLPALLIVVLVFGVGFWFTRRK